MASHIRVVREMYRSAGFSTNRPIKTCILAASILGEKWRRPEYVYGVASAPQAALYFPALRQIEVDGSAPPEDQNWGIGRELARISLPQLGLPISPATVDELALQIVLPLDAMIHRDLMNTPDTRIARNYCLPVAVVRRRIAALSQLLTLTAA